MKIEMVEVQEPPLQSTPSKQTIQRVYQRSGFRDDFAVDAVAEWYGAVLCSEKKPSIWFAHIGFHAGSNCKLQSRALLTAKLFLHRNVYAFAVGENTSFDQLYMKLCQAAATTIVPIGILVREQDQRLKRYQVRCGDIDSILGTDGKRFFAMNLYMWDMFVAGSLASLLAGDIDTELFAEDVG